MCWFICLALPNEDSKLREMVPESFELTDVTDWNIGKATLGNRVRGRSYLLTTGGCSCAILGTNHASAGSRVEIIVGVVTNLLKNIPCVSILIHDARGDISTESVSCKHKIRISLQEFIMELPRLPEDVRHVITDWGGQPKG